MAEKTRLDTAHSVRLKQPSDFEVVIWNDEVTTMDFVVHILTTVFLKEPQAAAALMMEVHENGHGIAGVYTLDIAASKKARADAMSAENGFPLKLTLREISDGA